jgi:hypothetical protein
VLIGTGMDLSVLNPFVAANREGLIVAAFLLVVAVLGKLAAGWGTSALSPPGAWWWGWACCPAERWV